MEDFKKKLKKPEEEEFFEDIQQEEIVGEVIQSDSNEYLEEEEIQEKKGKEEDLRQQAKNRFSKLAQQYRQKLDVPATIQKENWNEREARTIEENFPTPEIEEQQYSNLQPEVPPEPTEDELMREELEALRERLGMPMPFRVILTISGEELQNMVFDQDIVTIGRDANCDIVIDNLGASRIHAEIERLGKLYFLRDRMSKTGTFVKGKRVEEYVLNNGEEFFLAKHTLYFHKLDQSARGATTQKKLKSDAKAIKHMARTMAVDFRHLAQKQEIAPAYLHIEGSTRRIPFNKNAFFFGKSQDCDVQIGGFLIAEKHAVLVHEKKGFFLYHVGFFKPPIVGKKKTEYIKLKDGDRVRIGNLKFIFAIAAGKPEDEEDDF